MTSIDHLSDNSPIAREGATLPPMGPALDADAERTRQECIEFIAQRSKGVVPADFDFAAAFDAWSRTPIRAMNGARPSEMLQTAEGRVQLMRVMYALEGSVYL